MCTLVDIGTKPDMSLLFTCFGGDRKCYIQWAIMPLFQGSGRGLPMERGGGGGGGGGGTLFPLSRQRPEGLKMVTVNISSPPWNKQNYYHCWIYYWVMISRLGVKLSQHIGFNLILLIGIFRCHYDDAIMGAIGSEITSLTIVYSTVYSGADQSKHQSSASLAFVWGIHRGPVNSPHKWPVTWKMFLFDDVIMCHDNPLR